MTRRKTPDAMGDLLASEPVSQDDGKAVSRQDSKTTDRQDDKTVKATFYLSSTTAVALDRARLLLRDLVDYDDRTAITKSGIVDTILAQALAEIQRDGEAARRLAGKLAGQRG